MQCTAKKRDGEQCKGQAGDGEYCQIHRAKFAKNITHGKYAKPEILGVPARYHGAYQSFLADPRPFDLRNEMATLRALYVEIRENVDVQTENKVEDITGKLVSKLSARLKGNPEVMKKICTLVGQTAEEILREEIGVTWIGVETGRELGNILEQISRVGERMKKIQEGVKLEVSIDTNVLIRFIQQVIFPAVPEADRRQRIIAGAQAMAISAPAQQETMPELPEYVRAATAVER